MSNKKPKLLSLANVPELTPDNVPYQNWKFMFQNFAYGDSADMGDMVVYTQSHPDKAQTRFPYDEAKLRLAEEWSESSSEDEEEEEELKTGAGTSAGPSTSAPARSARRKAAQTKKGKRAQSKKARADRDYAMRMRRLGLYLSVAFKAPILVTMCMTVADRNPIMMLVIVEKRYGGTDMVDMIIRWQKYIMYNPKGDVALWLDKNTLLERQIQRDYQGKIPEEFFSAHLLYKLSTHPAFGSLDALMVQFEHMGRLSHHEVEQIIRKIWLKWKLKQLTQRRTTSHNDNQNRSENKRQGNKKGEDGAFVSEREDKADRNCYNCLKPNHYAYECNKECARKECEESIKDNPHTRKNCPRNKRNGKTNTNKKPFGNTKPSRKSPRTTVAVAEIAQETAPTEGESTLGDEREEDDEMAVFVFQGGSESEEEHEHPKRESTRRATKEQKQSVDSLEEHKVGREPTSPGHSSDHQPGTPSNNHTHTHTPKVVSLLHTKEGTDTKREVQNRQRTVRRDHLPSHVQPGWDIPPQHRYKREPLDKWGFQRCQGRNTRQKQCAISLSRRYWGSPKVMRKRLEYADFCGYHYDQDALYPYLDLAQEPEERPHSDTTFPSESKMVADARHYLRIHGNIDAYEKGEEWACYPPWGASEFHVRPFEELNLLSYTFAVKTGLLVVKSESDEESSPVLATPKSPGEPSSHYLNCQECLEAMRESAQSGRPVSVVNIQTVANLAQTMESGCVWEGKVVSWIADGSKDEFLTEIMLAIDEVFIRYATREEGKAILRRYEHVDSFQTPQVRPSVSHSSQHFPITSDSVLSVPFVGTGEEDEIEEVEYEGDDENEGQENTERSILVQEPGARDVNQSVSPQNTGHTDTLVQGREEPVRDKTTNSDSKTVMVYVHEKVGNKNHIYQDSGATQYICRDESLLQNVIGVKGVKFKTGNGERRIDKAGIMKIMRVDGVGKAHWLAKQAYYDPLMPINIIPTGSIDHFHRRAILHQNGQLFILSKPVKFPQRQVLVRGRLTKSLLYRWDNENDMPLPMHKRYVPLGAPTVEPKLG